MLHTTTSSITRAVAATLLLAFLGAPAWAEKPEWAGKGNGKNEKHEKNDKHAKGDKHDDDRGGKRERRDPRVGGYFNDRDRVVVRTYYDDNYNGKKSCPPGLAKKNNGCMPPGQAKKYSVGQRLPSNVVYYPVPQPVLVQLPPAPSGHKYVRVAADILLIAVGSSMVVDAMTDLMRM